MPSLYQTLLLLALITFVLAAPSPSRMQKRSFKVERVPNPTYRRSPGAGTRALVKAYRKYGVALPPGLVDAMDKAGVLDPLGALGLGKKKGKGKKGKKTATAKAPAPAKSTAKAPAKSTAKSSAKPTGTGSSPAASTGGASLQSGNGTGLVTATPEAGDLEFLAPISIGGQVMNMDFDTGSSDLWVFNSQLTAASQAGHTIFDPQKSATFKLLQGASFTISYGDGSGAAGNVGTDTVNIGGATVTSQAVELATSVSSSFVQDTQSNGLVGLAFSQLNAVKPNQQKTFFDNAKDSLPEPVFTADLRHNAVGAYEFGTIDTTKFQGSLSWAEINTTSGFWQFSSQKFQVGNGTPMNIAGGQAIADTGTTLLLASPAVVNAYYSQVQGAVNNNTVGGVTFPCNSELPDLQVDIGGVYMATVPGNLINFTAVDSANCFGGLQATPQGLSIYGDILFKSHFVAFNGGNNSIGMAPHS